MFRFKLAVAGLLVCMILALGACMDSGSKKEPESTGSAVTESNVPDAEPVALMNSVTDTATGSGLRKLWEDLADMPTARITHGVAAINEKVYAIGGGRMENGNFLCLKTVEEYNPVTDTWVSRADMPTARGSFGITELGGKIYAIGGVTVQDGVEVELSTVEVYDPVTDKWSAGTDMPTKRQQLLAASVNGKIYAIGGGSGKQCLVEEYDPASDKWTRKNDMNTPKWNAGVAMVNNRIYAIGGNSGNSYTDKVDVYNPLADKWESRTSMPFPAVDMAAVSVGTKIYVIGGHNYNDRVLEYDTETDIWTEKKRMPEPRGYFGAAEVNGKIFLPGGSRVVPGGEMKTMKVYDPALDK